MLKANLKLKKKEFDFILVHKQAKLLKMIRNSLFDIKIFETTPSDGMSRAFQGKQTQRFKGSVIISSKTFKKAVERNKVKRRFYSVLTPLSRNTGSSPIKTQGEQIQDLKNRLDRVSIICYPKKESLDIEFSILEKEVYNELNNFLK